MSITFFQRLLEEYEEYKEVGLDQRRVLPQLLHDKLWSLSGHPLVSLKVLGKSIEDRPISMISLGTGPTNVLLWAQMHGNESTASRAIFDVLNFFLDEVRFAEQKTQIFSQLTIHIIPVLNPDGAQRFDRLNALGIDLNRDAAKLQSPESKILKQAVDELKPLFGFNLHDQARVHAVGNTGHPATFTFLSPPYNEEREVNDVRERAMKLISHLTEHVEKVIPDHIGKWSDEFELRAFGDNITKWGTSVVLFESGGYPGDREKSLSRKLHFVAIIEGLHSIASGDYQEHSTEGYVNLPFNENRMMDVIIRNAQYEINGHQMLLDIGIVLNEKELPELKGFYLEAEIEELGDLSNAHGYQEFDASGLTLHMAKPMPETLTHIGYLDSLDLNDLYDQGIGWVKVKFHDNDDFCHELINLFTEDFTPPKQLSVGINPTFCLKDEHGVIKYCFINGMEVKQTDEDIQVQRGVFVR